MYKCSFWTQNKRNLLTVSPFWLSAFIIYYNFPCVQPLGHAQYDTDWCTCAWRRPPSLFRICFSLFYNDVKCWLEVSVISQSQQETDRILRVHLFIFFIFITALLVLLRWCIYITHSGWANSFRVIRAVWTHLAVIKRLWVIRREAFSQIRSGTHGWMEMILTNGTLARKSEMGCHRAWLETQLSGRVRASVTCESCPAEFGQSDLEVSMWGKMRREEKINIKNYWSN